MWGVLKGQRPENLFEPVNEPVYFFLIDTSDYWINLP